MDYCHMWEGWCYYFAIAVSGAVMAGLILWIIERGKDLDGDGNDL